MHCIKTAEPVIEILSLSDRPIILSFSHQGLLRKFDCLTPLLKGNSPEFLDETCPRELVGCGYCIMVKIARS